MAPSTRATKNVVAGPSTISLSSAAVSAGADFDSWGTSRCTASSSSGVTVRAISTSAGMGGDATD